MATALTTATTDRICPSQFKNRDHIAKFCDEIKDIQKRYWRIGTSVARKAHIKGRAYPPKTGYFPRPLTGRRCRF